MLPWIRREMTERSGRDRRQPRPANRPAVPAPTPPGSVGSALLPPFQASAQIFFLFSASAPRRLTGPPANGGGSSNDSRTHFLFLPAGRALLPAGTGSSPGSVSAFPPSPLTHSSPGTKCSPLKSLKLRRAFLPFPVQQAHLPASSLQTFLKLLGPLAQSRSIK